MDRKCFVKRLIPRILEYKNKNGELITQQEYNALPYTERGSQLTKTGTGCYEPDFDTPAMFETWGVDMDEGASYTVAIVRFDDGTCDMINVSNIKFTD